MPDLAVAASVRIGAGAGQRGYLAITNSGLAIEEVGLDPDSGQLVIGDAGGAGELTVRSATLACAGLVVVGREEGSIGLLKIDRNSVFSCGLLQLGTPATSAGLRIRGAGSSIDVGGLIIGSENASLSFEAATRFSPIRTQTAPVLGGALDVDPRFLRRGDDEPEVILIDNLGPGPISGAFDSVCIRSSRRAHYELSYHGGDGNDLALIRSSDPITTYELWATLHFDPAAPETDTDPDADPDLDGLCNAAEYKMGRSPLHPEGPWMVGTQTTDETTQVTTTAAFYSERSDREDVRLTIQGKLPGQHWQSSYITTRHLGEQWSCEDWEATAETVGVPDLRLFHEMQPNVERMNVLFVVADDLSDWVGCMGGHPQALSPHIDRLAERGMLFREAHAAATICNPSRVSLLTGVAPSTSGVYRNPQELRLNTVLANAVTLPGHFKASGYHAVGSGKVFHDPDAVSWNEYWPSVEQYKPPQYQPPNQPLNGITTRGTAFDWGPLDESVEVMSDYQIATWVGQRLQTLPADEPFFMGCGFFRPHLPFFAPQQYFDLFDPATIQLPPIDPFDLDDLGPAALSTINMDDQDAVEVAGQWTNAVHSYLASIAFMDDQVGRVLDFLDNSPHARNTVVVFLSDHGFLLGEKRSWRKQVLWERCTHVPLIVVAPGVTKPGSVCDAPVSLLDVFPTLADLCDVSFPAQLDGKSLLPQLEDPSRATLPVVTTRKRAQHGVRSERYHFIQYPTGEQELYDLWTDPNEWTNLIGTPGADAIVESLRNHLPASNAVPSP